LVYWYIVSACLQAGYSYNHCFLADLCAGSFQTALRMAKGKPWTDAENRLLSEMAEGGLNPQQIHDGGRFPERKVEATGSLRGVD
jgi:hypothetical protein